jgi:hypothetical protein
MGDARGNVLPIQPVIKADRLGKGLDAPISSATEDAAPSFFARTRLLILSAGEELV